MGDARETLARVADGAQGWALDADSHARFATLAHPDGAVVELRQERWGAPWVCDAGRPGRMHRAQHSGLVMAVMLACSPARSSAPEVCALYDAASAIVREWWADVAAQARVGTPEPLPVGAARVDAILASLAPGPDLRENILAAEVLRLRGERAALRAKVNAAHSEAETAYLRTREPHYAGERVALELVQEWLDAGAEGGGA